MDAILVDLLTCPACAGNFLPGPSTTCGKCGATCAVSNGIVSLIAAGAHTALDDIDYDAVYRVDAPASHAFAKSCLDLLGDRLPARIDTFLEIGAGTGLFTLGFLKQVPANRALITDISPAMLETCRRRLLDHGVGDQVQLRFATWDGADCLRPDTFDLIAGFSVLHHVLDYQRMLGNLRKALRTDGIALFLEPNYRFHVALIDTVCEIFASIVDDDGIWTAKDKTQLSDWLFENNTNLRFRGDEFVLAGREDKHLFDGTQLGETARAAGFDKVELVPFGGRSECYTALKVYSAQIGLQDAARNDLLHRFSRMLPGYFEHLADEDRAPSSLILLRAGDGTGNSRRADAPAAPLQVEFTPWFRFDITITVVEQDAGRVVAMEGWILGDVDVTYVGLALGDRGPVFPVRWMRNDINRAFNSKRLHPLRRALFSGLHGDEPQGIEGINASQAAGLFAIAADGREFVIGEVMLDAGSGAYTVTQIGEQVMRAQGAR